MACNPWPPQLPNAVHHRVPFRGQEIAVQDYHPTTGNTADAPAVILLHGFPDNHNLYDRVLPPILAQKRRVLTLDFVGWGDATKPCSSVYEYSHSTWTEQLQAVVTHLQLKAVVIVVHDASGPTGIDFAIADSERPPSQQVVKGLVLLNSYYSWNTPFLKPPPIFVFSTPGLRHVLPWAPKAYPAIRKVVFKWQVSKFFSSPTVAKHYVAKVLASPVGFDAFLALTAELNSALTQRTTQELSERAARMSKQLPVLVLFGDSDPDLTPNTARKMQALLPGADLVLIPGANHYVQMDEPQVVAQAILNVVA